MRRMLSVVLVLAAGCGKKDDPVRDDVRPADKPKPADKPPAPGLIDLQELAQDFRNEAKGDEKYTGRRLTAIGYMHALTKTETGSYVMSFGYFVDGFNWGKGDVYAHFPAGEAAKLTRYENRSPVYFSGRCDGKEGRGIAIRDCKIVPPPKDK